MLSCTVPLLAGMMETERAPCKGALHLCAPCLVAGAGFAG